MDTCTHWHKCMHRQTHSCRCAVGDQLFIWQVPLDVSHVDLYHITFQCNIGTVDLYSFWLANFAFICNQAKIWLWWWKFHLIYWSTTLVQKETFYWINIKVVVPEGCIPMTLVIHDFSSSTRWSWFLVFSEISYWTTLQTFIFVSWR